MILDARVLHDLHVRHDVARQRPLVAVIRPSYPVLAVPLRAVIVALRRPQKGLCLGPGLMMHDLTFARYPDVLLFVAQLLAWCSFFTVLQDKTGRRAVVCRTVQAAVCDGCQRQ